MCKAHSCHIKNWHDALGHVATQTRHLHALHPPGVVFVLSNKETAEGQHCAALVVYEDAAPDTSCAPGQSPLCKYRQVGSVLVDRMASLLAPVTEVGQQIT